GGYQPPLHAEVFPCPAGESQAVIAAGPCQVALAAQIHLPFQGAKGKLKFQFPAPTAWRVAVALRQKTGKTRFDALPGEAALQAAAASFQYHNGAPARQSALLDPARGCRRGPRSQRGLSLQNCRGTPLATAGELQVQTPETEGPRFQERLCEQRADGIPAAQGYSLQKTEGSLGAFQG